MATADIEKLTAALVSLAQDGIPPDIQELLTHGNPDRGIPPGALARALGVELRPFQKRVHAWVLDFFPEHGVNVPERARRFLEEAVELVQAVGLPDLDIMRNVSRVLQRPAGQPHQELGGSRVSLAALAEAIGLDERLEGERELERISAPGMRERMRAKQAEKVAEGVGE